MFENIAAIDIGTSSIKIVSVRTGLREFKVRDFIFENIIWNNEEDREQKLAEILTRIISENGLSDYSILANLPMQQAVIRNMNFPFSDEDKIADVIPFEAEDSIPFKLEDIVLDFQILKNREESGSTDVLLTAAQKEAIRSRLSVFNAAGIKPVSMGMESQALFECYRYFNRIDEESIIQIDIGNEKTVLNIIVRNNLLFTRCISIGTNSIYSAIGNKYELSGRDIIALFTDFNLDLTSFENNLQKDYQSILKIKKNTLKGIYEKTLEVAGDLIEQIQLTKMAFMNENPDIVFNRVLISGGGSNIAGIGSIISSELELPVVSLPFLDEYTESKIRNQFPTAFGMVLSYLNRKDPAISFLRGEFLPESSGRSIKQYYLAAAFLILAVIVLLINIIISSYLKSESNSKYTGILNERYKKYFHTRQPADDPIAEATKLLKEEKKEVDAIESLIHGDEKVINMLNDILSFFPKDDSFELKNLVINESVIRLDGKIVSSQRIDDFKNKLIESKKFDNVTLNTNMRKGNDILFYMTIKLKINNKTAEQNK